LKNCSGKLKRICFHDITIRRKEIGHMGSNITWSTDLIDLYRVPIFKRAVSFLQKTGCRENKGNGYRIINLILFPSHTGLTLTKT
jgi:hypothetical protein